MKIMLVFHLLGRLLHILSVVFVLEHRTDTTFIASTSFIYAASDK